MREIALGLFLALSIFIEGLVFVSMWGWFVIPLGAPEVNLAHGLGLMMLVNWCAKSHRPDPRELEKQISDALMIACIAWCLSAYFAWLM